jgi:hypothetical protein
MVGIGHNQVGHVIACWILPPSPSAWGVEITEGIAARRWTKLGVNQLGKLMPWRRAVDILVLAISRLGVAHEMEGGVTHLLSFRDLTGSAKTVGWPYHRRWETLSWIWWWPVIHHFVDWDRRLTGGGKVAIFASARVTRKMFTPISILRIAKLCAGFCWSMARTVSERLSTLTAGAFGSAASFF